MVSIITPFYNAEKFLANSIESVLAQTYTQWELLLIDDCSTDTSAAIAKGFSEKDVRIKIFRLNQNSGAGVARNKGIMEAKGDKIAFLDADDLWKAEKLSVQLAFMEENQIAICYSSYTLISENGKPLQKQVIALPQLNFKKLLRANYIGNLTAMYDISILGKNYMPSMRKRQDWALWLDLVKKAGTAYGIVEPLAYYRVRENSISHNKWEMLRYNFAVYNAHLGYSKVKSIIFMCRFLVEQFFIKPRQIINVKASKQTV